MDEYEEHIEKDQLDTIDENYEYDNSIDEDDDLGTKGIFNN